MCCGVCPFYTRQDYYYFVLRDDASSRHHPSVLNSAQNKQPALNLSNPTLTCITTMLSPLVGQKICSIKARLPPTNNLLFSSEEHQGKEVLPQCAQGHCVKGYFFLPALLLPSALPSPLPSTVFSLMGMEHRGIERGLWDSSPLQCALPHRDRAGGSEGHMCVSLPLSALMSSPPT